MSNSTYLDSKILKINQYVILSFLALSFVFDFIDKIEIFYAIDFIKFNRLLKATMVLYAIIFTSIHYKYYIKHLKYIGISLLAITAIFCFKYEFWSQYLNEYLRYSFMLVVFPVFMIMITNRAHFNSLKTGVYKLFKWFMIINAILIILGLIFEIHLFKTYAGTRFGYNGILLSQCETPFVYMAATSLFWYFKDKLMLAVVLVVAALSGIKGVFLGEFLLLVLLVFFTSKLSKKQKLTTVLLSIITFIISMVFTLMVPPFDKIIKDEGVISALFSYRIDNLTTLFSTMPNQAFNWFIGATGLQKIRIELQLVDILLFFGSIGVVIFAYLIITMYKKIALSVQSKIFFLSILFLSLLSGNLLYNPLASSFFVLISICISGFYSYDLEDETT